VVGFTAEATVGELAAIARERGILLIDDLGSGCLVDTTRFGLAHEPTVQESLAAGADLALFSGDKLLGGPQCGIIAGKTVLASELRRHPLARALRVDKLTIAALNATLQSYVEGREAEELPIWRMLSLDARALKRRARRWAHAAGDSAGVVRERTMVGGGSLPGESVTTWCTAIQAPMGATKLANALRAGNPPIVARIDEDRVLLDPRTVSPEDDEAVAQALARMLGQPVL
jgi:L-seryl-tRNA(Ser) seleniumtransferase